VCVCVCVCVQGSQKELLNLSQQEYANRIEELNQSLKEAWASDQKVKALKIVIQVEKHTENKEEEKRLLMLLCSHVNHAIS